MKHTITNISYQFQRSGAIIPVFRIIPEITIDDQSIFDIYLTDSTILNKSIHCGDVVETTIDSQRNITYLAPVIKGDPSKILHTNTCPICKSPLFKSTIGIGICKNLNCKAQLPKNILTFLSSLNFPFNTVNNRILDQLFVRGAIHSLEHLFHLEVNDFAFSNIEVAELCGFLSCLHKLRGTVSVTQILIGFNAWSDYDTLSNTVNIFNNLKLKTFQLYLLTNKLFLQEQNIICPQWADFISIPENVNTVAMLGHLLDH